jgi:aryl-alcohol dehydrogenase-like predicted oxidoreductase
MSAVATPTASVASVDLPTCVLGSTGRTVTRFGLGGEGVLRTHGREEEAAAVIAAAVASGVTYFDSAYAYAGSESYYGQFWERHPEARAKVFITSKSACRDAVGARKDLAVTLQRLRVPYIDLWQIHDVRSEYEIQDLMRRGGALEAFVEAKEAGQIRHIGVTGHHDPWVLYQAIRKLPVDTVLLPVNPVEGIIGGFLTDVIPEARKRKLGVIGMKVCGQRILLDEGLSPSELLRYALSEDIDCAIIGCSTPAEVLENAALAATASANPMSGAEKRELLNRIRRDAKELAYYRGRF